MAPLALLSTSDKTGLVDLARSLVEEFGFDLVSSGGTAKTLRESGLMVTKVSDYTGSPEILGGRVKTLHPRIHGGILARRNLEGDLQDLTDNDIRPINLVVVNLYPFEQTIAKLDVTLEEAIKNIDIGGPTLLRASAKNYAHLTILCDPTDYDAYLTELRQQGGTASAEFRKERAIKAFAHTAAYDRAITAYLTHQKEALLPLEFTLSGQKRQTMRYGENPHQSAAWYQTGTGKEGWSGATQLQGKELSYNNLVDLEAARQIITEFTDKPAVAILKHTNPCGLAVADTLVEAYQKALEADSTSAFGGIVALNQPIDRPTAEELTHIFLECVVAPGCNPDAQDLLHKKSKLRVLVLPDLMQGPQVMIKGIAGGFLLQESDRTISTPDQWEVVTEKQPTPEQLEELFFAWKVVKHVKSNAIVVTKNHTTCGIGAGQMNRVGAAKIALEQAGEKARGAVLGSDAFFPFDDSVRTAAAAGIEAIIQPGGSVRDKDSIAAANELGVVMVFTRMRHFLH
ncbi:MAG: bifunctional phosphoribosylaminoimidazolecarboxamide formyltransferase/IMP cyclohydrolase [Roseofilum sp. SBFL]|uniref:bifunctional phosphoribosylaminoimidazolecarboxamide formyltransferase/IMP cyclohydrolase n=1 Tax=unclassified Roseofilum TaxID=2620099 RepID=UPI001B13186B|nr:MULTISPECIES: bifunctional phosphoribosylaminoimidazolecarboxamide formyltransferase/IMP cyclohydrolase [unclassified Roseofilum]MBP0013960.1 bifunctional phosphoribosylaminoimidazolecarboxamide formyltransferase/IMP cyclohydrolase [Roseofilum sp. SID3]MBP0025275.1 bifunctional phosphoribosylaminoimidazolecarboxamide formyltransferase/IMP cyclohydrolase [Roseofilum sp. SID2]MBP0036483.1 bifunctional phosphoribosylaminoimidazolecarboxamide formyltransferase/IMP cyclohydrolase [Roseofilum sp. S